MPAAAKLSTCLRYVRNNQLGRVSPLYLPPSLEERVVVVVLIRCGGRFAKLPTGESATPARTLRCEWRFFPPDCLRSGWFREGEGKGENKSPPHSLSSAPLFHRPPHIKPIAIKI